MIYLLYCARCPWEHEEAESFGMKNECPDCGAKLQFIRFKKHERGEARSIINARRAGSAVSE